MAHNRVKCKRKSGGIGAFVKNYLVDRKLVNFCTSNNENILWLKIHKEVCGIDIMCGAVYIEPEGSVYTKEEVFDSLAIELNKHSETPVLLNGDFNARTGKLCEINNASNFNPQVVESSDTEGLLQKQCLNINRNTKDLKINKYGRQLVSTCKHLDLVILNGRVGTDSAVGEFTCKSCSVIDYCIISDTLLCLVQDFSVESFNECFSDVHCPIKVLLKKSQHNVNKSNLIDTPTLDSCKRAPPKPSWQPAFGNEFVRNLDIDRINELCTIITELQAANNVTQSDIDNIYNEVKAVLHNGAQSCGSIKMNRPQNRYTPYKTNNRPKRNVWWDDNCEKARKRFIHARNHVTNATSAAIKTVQSKL